MYDKTIEAGIIMLLIYMPLAFGGVLDGSVFLMEITVGLMMLVWLAKMFSQRRRVLLTPGTNAAHYRLRLIVPSFLLPLLAFCALVVFQMIPLPTALLRFVSPAAYHFYADAASAIQVEVPHALTVSMSRHATETGFHTLMAYTGVFFLIVNNLRSPRQIKRLMYTIAAVGVVEAFYGLLDYLSGGQQIFLHHHTHSFGLSGSFVNKNHFAGYLELAIPLLLSLLVFQLEERRQMTAKKRFRFLSEKFMKVVLIGFLSALTIGALLLSGSRGGLLSFAAGMLFFTALAYSRRIIRKRAPLILLVLLTAFVAAILLGHGSISSRLQTLADLDSDFSFQLRRKIWNDTFSMFRASPIFGTGLGSFPHIYPQSQSFPSDLRIDHAENDYLQLLTETGAIGAFLVLCILALFLHSTIRAWMQRQARWAIIFTIGGLSGLSCLLLHSFIDFNLHLPSNAFSFTVIAALSSVSAHSHRRTPK
ncbi:hypothetical protein CSB45_02560 [candidate division KSB3 bacterium]|uniref:O-antigen ligase-related domain-containing protein n=1 Tax=candidate division KSB3 bacterium TaxID=2044937 RepID=A0A2G6EAV7_9BACT|nr:MAG: hypothetical protein CSB45_02560 [candidate division KSB3 bacterium]PIE30962.1 MAG: hypothetical protein CSA57_01175 [candidate division KSB3 bacterium]